MAAPVDGKGVKGNSVDLSEWIRKRRAEVAEKARVCPVSTLPPSEDARAYSLRGQLLSLTEINLVPTLARRRPDGDPIPDGAFIERAHACVHAGAKAIALWCTGEPFPGGCIDDLRLIRAEVRLPILVLDLVVDAYQIYEAAHHGANGILLSAAWLDEALLDELLETAHDLHMDVVLAAETSAQLERVLAKTARIVGLFGLNPLSEAPDLDSLRTLLPSIPQSRLPMVLGGVKDYWEVKELHELGAAAFVVDGPCLGEDDPAETLRNLRGLFT